MKYVAFIDTLGFKQRISNISHHDAVEVIRKFNQTVYDLWSDLGYNDDTSLKGRTFSDSLIISSSGNSNQELKKIIQFLIQLFKVSITNCDFPLRGGLSVGNFDDLKATEFKNLNKGLIVGTAFIEAYLLESSKLINGSKLLFGQEINLKINRNFSALNTRRVLTDKKGFSIYELKWGDIEYLTENNHNALNKFVELATKSKWLNHYYGTLETFLIKETSDDKREIFGRIVEKLKSDYEYFDLDNFIENYLKSDNATFTKRSFLRYIREKL